MKAIEQYFHVVLFIMLCKVVLTLRSVDEILSSVWPFKWKLLSSTLRRCCLWLCLIFVQKFLWESSKTTRTKTCREKDKEQWMETKTSATGTPQEACITTCFTRKTCSWKAETKGASKSSRSSQACSGSTGKTTLIFWARPRIGKENRFYLIVSRTTRKTTARRTFGLTALWIVTVLEFCYPLDNRALKPDT